MSNRVRSMALYGASAPEFVTGPSPLGKGTTIALALVSSLLAVAAIKFSLPAFAAVVLAMVLVAGCSTLGSRPFAVFGLILSLPFSLAHHFVYRPNMGASDGLAVYLTDLWVVWLLVDSLAKLKDGFFGIPCVEIFISQPFGGGGVDERGVGLFQLLIGFNLMLCSLVVAETA